MLFNMNCILVARLTDNLSPGSTTGRIIMWKLECAVPLMVFESDKSMYCPIMIAKLLRYV